MSSIRFFWIGEESEIFVAASRESFWLALREYGAECNASINASKMDAARDRVLELYEPRRTIRPRIRRSGRRAGGVHEP